MKTSILTQILAGAVGAVASVLATIAGLIFLVIKVLFQLPTTAINSASFFAKQFAPKPSNRELNAKLFAHEEWKQGKMEFIIVAGSGKNGDEDRKLPFPKGYIESQGFCPEQAISDEQAKRLAAKFLMLNQLRDAIAASIQQSRRGIPS